MWVLEQFPPPSQLNVYPRLCYNQIRESLSFVNLSWFDLKYDIVQMNYKPYHQFTQKGFDSMWISVISCKIGVLECKRMYPLDHFCEISHYWSLCSWLLENLLSWSVCNLHYLTFLDYKLDEIPPPKKNLSWDVQSSYELILNSVLGTHDLYRSLL